MGAATAGVVAAVAGDVIASSSAQGINEANLQNVTNQDVFNAAQAQQNRQFQEDMADTQMQRRVVDLKAAGLNPALGYTQGGAAAPSGTSAQSVGVPNLQNPGAPFAQLGSQVTSAMQLQTQQAQIDLMKANAAKATAQTEQEIPANVDLIKSQIGVNDQRAQEVNRNVKMLDIALSPITDAGGSMYASNMVEQTMQNHIKTDISLMDQQERSDTLALLIKARNDSNLAISLGMSNLANASDSEFARLMSYFQLAKPALSTAQSLSGTAATVGGMMP